VVASSEFIVAVIEFTVTVVVAIVLGFVEFHGVVRRVIGCAVRITASRF
jgi:hypothetical protein